MTCRFSEGILRRITRKEMSGGGCQIFEGERSHSIGQTYTGKSSGLGMCVVPKGKREKISVCLKSSNRE